MPRKRYPTIKQGADGLWHAWVTVGTKPNGRPDQRHVKRATYEDAEKRVDDLLAQKQTGRVQRPGRALTFEQWMETYLDTIAPRRCDPGTIRDYRSIMRNWVYPLIGSTRIDQLQPEQLDEIYLGMQRAGRAESMVVKAHRVLKRALEAAYRRGHSPVNVAALIDSPTAAEVEQDALTQDGAEALLDATEGRRNKARWSTGLAVGLRQGEALGWRWPYLDLDAGEARIFWQLRRRAFEHGCGDDPCGHRRGGNCPKRHLPLKAGEVAMLDLSRPPTTDQRTGMVLKPPKGKSKRTIPLPEQLVEQLREQKVSQDIERILAGDAWQDHEFVFAQLDGQPIDPKDDYAEWRELLTKAGLPPLPLHGGRHTAASILILLGVPIEIVQELFGHSDVRVTRRYTHVASEMAKKATQRMGDALLKRRPTPSRTP